MERAPIPEHEAARLADLEQYKILDTAPEEAFESLTRLAAQICGTPIALVSLIDTYRQWFKAKVGIDAPETPCNTAFFTHTIHQSDLLIVLDATQDPRFADNPLVTGDAHIRFYAGMPLTSREGHAMGTFCVIDREPKHLTPNQIAALKILGQQVVSQLELRRRIITLERTIARQKNIEQGEARLLRAIDHSLEGVAILNKDGCYTYMNPAHADVYGYTIEELIGQSWQTLYAPEWSDKINRLYFPILLAQGHWRGEVIGRTKFGSEISMEISLALLQDQSDPAQCFICTCRDVTAQKATEHLLRFKQDRLTDAQALAHIGSWDWDIITGAETWSDEQYRIFGYAPQAITPTYDTFREALHPNDHAPVFQAVEATVAHDLPYDIECRIIRPSGEERTIHCRGKVTRDTLGKPIRMAGTVQDITERKQTAKKLEIVNHRLRIATESAGIGVWEYEIQDNRLVWDDQMLALYDYSPEDFPGTYEAWSQRLHPEDKPQAERALQESIERHREFDTEFRLTLPSGAIRHIKSYAQVLKNDDGASTRIIGVTYDITERKQAEEDREEQALRLRAIVDHAVDGIVTINEDGLMESFNPAAERLFGYTAAEAIGQNVKMLMPEPYHSEHDGYLANYRRTGHANIIGLRREVLGRRKDGSVFSFELGISEIQLGMRRIFTGTIHDITERKQAEFSLLQDAVEMDSHNQQLAEARDQALAATRAKSAFLASMSHEIRTPMNAIIGMADLLQETSLSPDQEEYVHRFSRAATSLLDLINDILDISKIEAGHLELETVPFDLHDLVDKTVELMAVRANTKTLELAAFVHPDVPPWVAGDPTRLRQVFVNLLGNAIKFTEQGQVLLRIEPDPADPLNLRCSASDTGIGISEDKRKSIFESFTQVDSSTTRKYGGTGLGLSICKQLVEMMGGELSVESTLGAGSTFSFGVRLAAAPALTPETIPPLAIQGCRILVVDDNNANRLIVREHLRHFGAWLVEAHHGTAALEALKEAQRRHESFSLAIVDYDMPDMNGLDLVEAIRARPECATLPVVLYTSEIRGTMNHRARQLGIVSTVYKPISRKRLLTAVAVALGQTPAGEDAPESPLPTPTPSALQPIRILLVEDLEDNRDVVRLFLKDTPYHLDMAENGAIGVEKFQAGAYDLVFMDMQMPVMDGLQATAAIRQWECEHQRVPTPIVSLTANAFQEEIDKSLAAGCTAHATKPIKKKVLLKTILDHTSSNRTQEAA